MASQGQGRISSFNFRNLPIVPPPDFFLLETGEDISANRIREPYASAEEYLESQFMLLREDLLLPYRRALEKLSNDESCSDLIEMYQGSSVVGINIGPNGTEFGVRFRGRNGLDWKSTRLLMHNSLLCLSSDEFRTFHFAVVSSRDINALEYTSTIGLRSMRYKNSGPHDHILHEYIYRNKCSFKMFECRSCYLEAYLNALTNLQRPHMEELRFLDKFIRVPGPIEILNFGINWNRFCEGLDRTQQAAVRHGLTRSLAIIQGPPGTGKTFTALRIVKALVAEGSHEGPILVVCYTNRALDQFLEGILEYEENLVRLGSGTVSRVLGRRHSLQKAVTDAKNRIPERLLRKASVAESYKRQVARHFRRKLQIGFNSPGELLYEAELHDTSCWEAIDANWNKFSFVLKQVKVVGMTATFAARNHELLLSLGSQIMVVEEAAHVTEAQVVGCLIPTLKRLILIGDHKQLRPSVSCYDLAILYKLDVSLFERLVVSGVEYRTLGFQRRMPPEISCLVTGFYRNQLGDHPSVEKFPDVRRMAENVLFIDHENPEETAEESGSISKKNSAEAQMIVALCGYLKDYCQYSPSDITVLCMYRAQVDEIQKRLRSIYMGDTNMLQEEVEEFVPRVRSVDEFQGQESTIVLLSLVRNGGGNPGSSTIGFTGSRSRICVALSRAKHGLYIFGSKNLLQQKSIIWTQILKQITVKTNSVTLICPWHERETFEWDFTEEDEEDEDEQDDHRKRPIYEGFCRMRCGRDLRCGHTCTGPCHFASECRPCRQCK